MQYSPSGQINHTLAPSSQNSRSQFNFIQNRYIDQQQQFSPILLQNKLKQHKDKHKHINANSTHQNDEVQFINSNSIVKRYQLLLITCLIMSSIASVKYSTEGYFDHIKTIRDYFNSQLLGNTFRGIYEYGDNIDEPFLQIEIFQDMNEHFDNFIEVLNNFTDVDGFTVFEKQTEQNVILSYTHLNQTNIKEQMTIGEFQYFLFFIDRRQFLLKLKQMQVNIHFGKNKRIEELNLTVNYDLSSRMLLNVELQLNYTPNAKYIKNYNDNTIRIIEQLLAFFLLCSYLHNAYTIKIQNNRLQKLSMFYDDIKILQKNRSYWCYSLVVLNIITILTQSYAPLTSFLQLLPVFQRHDSANVYKYNFNTNLRYAVPLVLRILIPVIILLNGFIFYSMLMYPGEYFEDYTMGLFSYVYQNFQVGTYQIFIELQSRGNFAYMLYGILYFYMVLVGSNLLPALFCTMIYIKIYQNDLKDHIRKTIKSAICPNCNHQNFQDQEDDKLFELNIMSPKISPYLKGKLSTASNKTKEINLIKKVTKMYVESENVEHEDRKEYLKSKVQKIKVLTSRLQQITKQTTNKKQQSLFLTKIDRLVQQTEETVILSPVRSPKKQK